MFGSGLYNVKPPKTVVTRPSSTAILALNSKDRFSLDGSAQSNSLQQYNDFTINKNQNLMQGAFNRIQLTEMRFPWAIPNINARNNKFYVWANTYDINDLVLVTIGEGFYTGAELATAVEKQIIADCSGVAAGIVNLDVQFNPRGFGEFEFSMTAGTGPFSFDIFQYSDSITDPGGDSDAEWISTNQLMKTMGLYQLSGTTDLYTTPLQGGTAPMLYTEYVDIVSEQLTNFQKVKDITTNVPTARQALIERLYITNETSQNDPANIPGTYPFTIMRQVRTPKSIRWSGEHSIGQVDIKLYDMYGQPLYLPTLPDVALLTPRQLASKLFKKKVLKNGLEVFVVYVPLPDFQLTFLASED